MSNALQQEVSPCVAGLIIQEKDGTAELAKEPASTPKFAVGNATGREQPSEARRKNPAQGVAASAS